MAGGLRVGKRLRRRMNARQWRVRARKLARRLGEHRAPQAPVIALRDYVRMAFSSLGWRVQ
jgi:hypothetical protein